MHSTAHNHVGGLLPVRPTAGGAARPVSFIAPDLWSNPSEHKLLTPPPPQIDIQFQGIEASESEIHWGILLLGKILILQGVGHPISCLGVCYANDPPKGGVYDAR